VDVAKLRVVIDGDSKGAEQALEKTSRSVKDTGKKMMMSGAMMTAGVTVPLAGIGIAAFNAASDLSESQSKVQVVFGESAASIEAFAKTAATNLGMSQQQALEATGTFGNLMSAMGIATPKAADMSKEFVGLAADLASFNNASPEETLAALKSGLTGETEPLKRFGVNLNQARIEAEALRMGLAKAPVDMRKVELATNALNQAQADLNKKQKEGTASAEDLQKAQDKVTRAEMALEKSMEGGKVELDAAAKAQAAYSLIMKDTTLAQGDFGRTADGAANQQRILGAQLRDTAASIGQELLPVGLKLLGFVRGLLERFNALSPGVKKVILIVGGLAAAIGPLLTLFGGVATAIGILASPIGIAIAAIAALAVGVVLLWKRSEKFRTAVLKAWDSIKGAVAKAGEVIQAILAKIRDWMGRNEEKVTALKTRFEGVFTTIAGIVRAAADVITGVLTLVQAFWDRWGDHLLNSAIGFFGGILNIVQGALEAVRGVFELVAGLLTGDTERMSEGIKAIFGGLAKAILGIFQALGAPLGFIMQVIEEQVVAPIKRALDSVVTFITGLPRRIADAAVGMWDGIKTAFRSALNWIIDGWNSLDFKLPSFDGLEIAGQTVIPGWEGPTLGLPHIPRLAKGGLVTAPTMALIGEAGPEAVIPLTRGNATLDALAAALAREVSASPRSSGAAPVNVTTNLTITGSRADAAAIRDQLAPLLDERDAALLRAIRAR
jgi:hypothetical protein